MTATPPSGMFSSRRKRGIWRSLPRRVFTRRHSKSFPIAVISEPLLLFKRIEICRVHPFLGIHGQNVVVTEFLDPNNLGPLILCKVTTTNRFIVFCPRTKCSPVSVVNFAERFINLVCNIGRRKVGCRRNAGPGLNSTEGLVVGVARASAVCSAFQAGHHAIHS